MSSIGCEFTIQIYLGNFKPKSCGTVYMVYLYLHILRRLLGDFCEWLSDIKYSYLM